MKDYATLVDEITNIIFDVYPSWKEQIPVRKGCGDSKEHFNDDTMQGQLSLLREESLMYVRKNINSLLVGCDSFDDFESRLKREGLTEVIPSILVKDGIKSLHLAHGCYIKKSPDGYFRSTESHYASVRRGPNVVWYNFSDEDIIMGYDSIEHVKEAIEFVRFAKLMLAGQHDRVFLHMLRSGSYLLTKFISADNSLYNRIHSDIDLSYSDDDDYKLYNLVDLRVGGYSFGTLYVSDSCVRLKAMVGRTPYYEYPTSCSINLPTEGLRSREILGVLKMAAVTILCTLFEISLEEPPVLTPTRDNMLLYEYRTGPANLRPLRKDIGSIVSFFDFKKLSDESSKVLADNVGGLRRMKLK